MANETTYGDLITLAAAVDAKIVPMFTSAVLGPRLVTPFSPGVPNTRAKDLPKSGIVTASVISEASAATSQTVTDTKVTLTLQKAVVLFRPTIESWKFASGADAARFASMGGQACAKKFDQDLFAEFLNASQSTDAGATMTVSAIQAAAVKVRKGNIPSDRLACVLHYDQAHQVGNDIRQASGAFYGNPNFDPQRAVSGSQPVPGYLGFVFGVDLYESGNTTTNGGDNAGAVFAPQYAYAALYPDGQAPAFETEIAPQTEFASSILNVKTMMWYHVKEYVDAATVLLRSDTVA